MPLLHTVNMEIPFFFPFSLSLFRGINNIRPQKKDKLFGDPPITILAISIACERPRVQPAWLQFLRLI